MSLVAGMGFVVAFYFEGRFVCVVAILCAIYVVAVFDVFAVDTVETLVCVFGVCDVVAGAVLGFCDECRFVEGFVFLAFFEFFD